MIEQIFLSVAVFSGLVLMLVLILNFAESKLLPQGDVTIEINGDSEKNITTRPGSTLLSVLAGQSVFLPSACGGGGTCAMCECRHSHIAQVPPPPHADGRKTDCPASTLNRVLPGRVVIFFSESPFISMVTSP